MIMKFYFLGYCGKHQIYILYMCQLLGFDLTTLNSDSFQKPSKGPLHHQATQSNI